MHIELKEKCSARERLGYEEKDEWIFEDFVKERLKSLGILKQFDHAHMRALYPLYLLTIGIFHPIPNALGVIFMQGVACHLLYSAFLILW